MNKKTFDKKLKGEMETHQSPVNIDEIWDAIEPEVDAINNEKRKKRRFFFFWLFGGLMILGGIGYGINLNLRPSLSLNQSANKTEKKPSDSSINLSPASSVNTDASTAKTSLTSESTLLNTNKNNKTRVNQNTSLDLAQTKKAISPKKSHSSSSKNKKENNSTPYTTTNNKTPNYIEAPAENIISNQTDTATAFGQKIISDGINPDKKDIIPSKNNSPNSTTKDQQGSNLAANSDDNLLDLKSMNQLLALPIEAILNNTIINITKDSFVEDLLGKMVLVEERKNNTKDSEIQFFAEVIGGASWPSRKLSGTGVDNAKLIENRNTYEHQQEAIHGGFNVGIQLKKSGLEFMTGLQYTRIAEYLELNDTRNEFDTIPNGIQFYYRNLEDELIPVYGEVINQRIIERRKKTYNSHQLIDIPLLIGYNKISGKKERLSFGAQAGVFVNLSLKSSGEIIGEDLTILDMNLRNAPIFKSKLGISYHLGLSARYALDESKKWWLSLSPSFRYIPQSFALDTYSLEQKYNLIGVNLGLRYSFK